MKRFKEEAFIKKKLLFICNAHAGKEAIKNNLLGIIDIFIKGGYEISVHLTQKAEEAIEYTRENASKYDMLVCSGGDGTLDEVVTGLMKCEIKPVLGYIPAGSTNDFANSLQIPKNMLKAAEVVMNGKSIPCDVGSFNQDTFVYIAAFGMFTEVSYETDQNVKNLLGHVAYLLEGMKRLPMMPSHSIKVIYDDGEIEGEFMFGMITNSDSVAGFKRLTGRCISLDDGLFEVTLIKKPKNPIELNSIIASLVISDIDTEHMYCFKTSHLEIESREEIAWSLDGEFGGNHKNVIIDNCKHAINIMAPL